MGMIAVNGKIWPGKDALQEHLRNKSDDAIITYWHHPGAIETGVRYPFDDALNARAHKLKMHWDGKCWVGKPEYAAKLIDAATAKFPDLPVTDWRQMLKGVKATVRDCGSLLLFCSGKLCRRYAEQLLIIFSDHHWLGIGSTLEEIDDVIRLIDKYDAYKLIESLRKIGAEINVVSESIKKHPVSVSVQGWKITVRFHREDVRHLAFAAPYVEWHNNKPKSIPWEWSLLTTRNRWPALRDALIAKGISWRGHDPETTPVRPPVALKYDLIGGWKDASHCGFVLYDYQRAGVEFCASRGMRALLADEMGTGKTAQAIACARGSQAKKITIVCPKNARYVWDREIRVWSQAGIAEQHIRHATITDPDFPHDAEWTIINYDLLVIPTISISVCDNDVDVIQDRLPRGVELLTKRNSAENEFMRSQWRLQINSPVKPDADLHISDELRNKWRRAARRLQKHNSIIASLIKYSPDMLILDEAHHLKNEKAKRTVAVRQLSRSTKYVLALTGTPVRNHAGEASMIMSLLDPSAEESLAELSNGKAPYLIKTEQAVRDYLAWFMIRRRKDDVLIELPPKVRQWVPFLPDMSTPGNRELLSKYYEALTDACNGDTVGVRQIGAMEKAVAILAQLKVADGQLADSVRTVVQERRSCIVFGRHLTAMDLLEDQFIARGITVVRIDGSTNDVERANAVRQFQDGNADVFLGSIRAGGEAITLTRADTCVFYELPWVPSEILQAEDRGHRAGQVSSRYHVQIYHALGMATDEILVELHAKKLARINRVLTEDTNIFLEATDAKISLIREVAERLRASSMLPVS